MRARFAVVASSGLVLLSFVACGEGTDAPLTVNGKGGFGGTSGAAGSKAGGAGASGVAGAAGLGGKAGAAGAPAGASGAGGASGVAGASGAAGGVAGKGGASGSSAGSGTAGTSTAGASGSGAAGSATAGAGGGSSGPDTKDSLLAKLTHACADGTFTFYDPVTAPSPWTADKRGTIARCLYDKEVSKADIDTYLTTYGISPGATTSIHKLRIVYFTETLGGAPVATSGVLYVPATRVAATAPLVVFGHGTLGGADKCAPSRETGVSTEPTWKGLSYGVAGRGYPVLVPDYPGLGMGGPQAWNLSAEEGHSLLDATRAARLLAKPGLFSTKNAVLGHSEGGHAALSAQSQATAYGTSGTVDTFVVYAPFWASNAAWGAIISAIGQQIAPPETLPFALQYFYGHLSAYEGQGHELDAFEPAKAQQVKSVLEGECIVDQATQLGAIGVTKASDIFTSAYRTSVGNCGLSDSCTDMLSLTWRDRWVADRPAIDPARPIVLWQGGQDLTVAPAIAQCGVDRIVGQGATPTLCGVPTADHATILASAYDWTMAHLGEKLLGGPAAGACPSYASLGQQTCQNPPSNSTLATDP